MYRSDLCQFKPVSYAGIKAPKMQMSWDVDHLRDICRLDTHLQAMLNNSKIMILINVSITPPGKVIVTRLDHGAERKCHEKMGSLVSDLAHHSQKLISLSTS
jgi:hypothetical protein